MSELDHSAREQMAKEFAKRTYDRGVVMLTAEDEKLDGRTIRVNGRKLLNFGSCSYLGLELDPRLKEGTAQAVERFGTQFSSSRAYVSAPGYGELEPLLEQMFGTHVLVVPTTTLGHMAALPALIGPDDAVVADHQVHQSVQFALNHLRVKGSAVELVKHNRVDLLKEAISRLERKHSNVWYLADGVYSMFADFAPYDALRELLAEHPRLHIYIDDAHGIGCFGRNGRGPTMELLGRHDRVYVAASLCKSFACGGAALLLPSLESMWRIRTIGGPMIFSGPIQPPMLGAAIASARIHLSDELSVLQQRLRERMDLCDALLSAAGLKFYGASPIPIRYVPVGMPDLAVDVVAAMIASGFYVNLAAFPAVPLNKAGIRFTLTVHLTPDDIRALVAAISFHMTKTEPRL